MRTNGEFVSRVAGDLKALNKDGRISRRLVLGIGQDKAKFLISQKMDEMTMSKEEGLITNIECFRLEKIKVKYCDILEFRLCNKLMKSKNKLPDSLYGKTGSSVLSVMSVDGSKTYDYITPRNYKKLSNRKYKIKDKSYYYTKDNYLYLLDTNTELVDIEIITMDKDEAENVSECSGQSNSNSCKSKWDQEFVCPDRFYDLVVKDTLQEVANIWRTSQKDENPNLDENQKTRTVP